MNTKLLLLLPLLFHASFALAVEVANSSASARPMAELWRGTFRPFDIIRSSGLTSEQRSWLTELENQKRNPEESIYTSKGETVGCYVYSWDTPSKAAVLDGLLKRMATDLDERVNCQRLGHETCVEYPEGSGGELYRVDTNRGGGILQTRSSDHSIDRDALAAKRLTLASKLLYREFGLYVSTRVDPAAVSNLRDLIQLFERENITIAQMVRQTSAFCGGGASAIRP